MDKAEEKGKVLLTVYIILQFLKLCNLKRLKKLQWEYDICSKHEKNDF